MNYKHKYYKLSNRFYTTIRKTKKTNQVKGFIESEIVQGLFSHKAIITNIETVILANIPESVLIMDCIYPKSQIDSREKCYALFQSFYQIQIDFSKQKWYLFLMYQV